jgi:ABC-type branched-subunit amino acid transport system substrate-binding protein
MLAIAGAALAACGAVPSNIGPTINPSQAVPVALLVPSGSGASGDEIVAQSLENAARLAIADLQGVEIDLRIYSTAGSAEIAASQATLAVDEGAKIILGPVYAASANAAGLAVANRDVNVLSFSNNPQIAGGNVFILESTFQNTADRVVSYATSQGRNNIVVVYSEDEAGQQGRTAIEAAIAGNGATLAGSVGYALSQQDVVRAIPRIKTAVDQSAANAVFMTSPTSTALPLLTQLMPEQGISPEVTQYLGLTRWDIPAQTLALPGVQGGWFAVPDPAASGAFSARYQAAYGQTPHPIGGLAFDGIAAVGALVGQGNSEALTRGALTQGAGFRGAGGVFRLLPDGTNQRGLAIATITDQQVRILSGAPQGFSGAGF